MPKKKEKVKQEKPEEKILEEPSEDKAGDKPIKKVIKAFILKEGRIISESSNEARELYNQSRFGKLLDDGKVQLSLIEAMYLLEKGKLAVLDGKSKPLDFEHFLKKVQRYEPNCWVRYCVFKDIRSRGYIVKTALKFGAGFRVYDIDF